MPADETDDPQKVTLIDESGRERRFTLHDAFDLEGAAYYLVEGVDEPDDNWKMPTMDFVDCISFRVTKRSVARG